ncbi:MAG: hypothetical protein JJ891_07235 [Rhizobiaceae bacterium]|jgi:predicted membrane chloride channel (bestrophin family)|nr:hypothetical protein [Rhizobiaceae bacterium]
MVDEKNWYESRTIWGALMAVTASFAGMAGVTIDTMTQGELVEAIIQLVGGAGALLAVYGRLAATNIIR